MTNAEVLSAKPCVWCDEPSSLVVNMRMKRRSLRGMQSGAIDVYSCGAHLDRAAKLLESFITAMRGGNSGSVVSPHDE